jgi:hypothetical protein
MMPLTKTQGGGTESLLVEYDTQHRDNTTRIDQNVDDTSCVDKNTATAHESPASNSNGENAHALEESFLKEIRQVQRKIRNLQESIQLSTNIAQPLVWQDNGLNGALNIVNQWKTIVVFYSKKNQCDDFTGTKVESHSDDCREIKETKDTVIHQDSIHSKEVALQVYGMIQMVMQTGPLKGSNPGYFKRCGGPVAKMAKEFLVKCIQNTTDGQGDKTESVENNHGNGDDLVLESDKTQIDCSYVVSHELRFTSQQERTLLKWIKDADKAIAANKLPSKSAMKLQTSINTKGMSRRDKRKKGQLVKNIIL